MVQLVITGNTGAVQAKLQALARRTANMQPALDEIGAALVSSTQLRFSRGVDPDGHRWLVSLRAKQDHGQTLIDTARLRQSITHRATRTAARIGTNVVYGPIHQFGGDITRYAHSRQLYFRMGKDGTVGNRFVKRSKSNFAQWATVGEHVVTMPKRPFLGISDRDRHTISDIIDDYLAGAVS